MSRQRSRSGCHDQSSRFREVGSPQGRLVGPILQHLKVEVGFVIKVPGRPCFFDMFGLSDPKRQVNPAHSNSPEPDRFKSATAGGRS